MKRPINDLTDDFLDGLIDKHFAASSDQLAPSSGFVLSVMDTIEAQAAEPPPIAFPWTRALPGLVAAVCTLALLLTLALRAGRSVSTLPTHTGIHALTSLGHSLTPSAITLACIAVAAFLSIAAVAASFRLTGRSQ